MARTIKDIRNWSCASLLNGIISLNIAIWLLLRIAVIVLFLITGQHAEQMVCKWVELPSYLTELPIHWYGLFTYMFAQFDVLHILFNMLWLYWFGRMFLEISSERSLTALYLMGGIAGGLLFVAVANILPYLGSGGWLIGASASVLAIVTATAILMPDYPVYLFLLGQVKLKWIAIVSIVLVLISVSGPNSGGEIAHIGGILMGAVYALMRRRGTDITRPVNHLIDSVVNTFRAIGVFFSHPHLGVSRSRRTSARKDSKQQRVNAEQADRDDLDRILDKIKTSGYGGLTAEERKRLFEVSSRIK